MILFCREFGSNSIGNTHLLVQQYNKPLDPRKKMGWSGRNTIRRLNFRGLTLIPTPKKSVNKIMGKLFKRYWMLTQANMKKTKRELKFEPAYDIKAD